MHHASQWVQVIEFVGTEEFSHQMIKSFEERSRVISKLGVLDFHKE